MSRVRRYNAFDDTGCKVIPPALDLWACVGTLSTNNARRTQLAFATATTGTSSRLRRRHRFGLDRKQQRSKLERVPTEWASRLLLLSLPTAVKNAAEMKCMPALGDEQRLGTLLPL